MSAWLTYFVRLRTPEMTSRQESWRENYTMSLELVVKKICQQSLHVTSFLSNDVSYLLTAGLEMSTYVNVRRIEYAGSESVFLIR